MSINIIVARGRNNVIGKNNQVPWRLKNDLIRLKSLIMGRVVILGRKTYDSLSGYYDKSGRPMPAERYIVVTRQLEYKPARKNVIAATSFEEAVKKAEKITDEIFVIGGARIYDQALPFAKRLYVTEVDANVNGDTYFSKIDPTEWTEMTREKHKKDEDHDYDYDFVVLDKR